MNTFRIATRKSPLALYQARFVARCLRELHPDLRISLVPRTSAGDRVSGHPLAGPAAGRGGKGLFTGELEGCLRRGTADAAVHSMKDVTVREPEGLCLGAVMARISAGDALISRRQLPLAQLPPAARVGTSSLRRRCQLAAAYPNFRILPLRGNVQTRLEYLARGELDAVVLAVAGLQRLGLEHCISEYLPEHLLLPAIGQGALGVQVRTDDERARRLAASLNHEPSRRCVQAERAVSRRLGADCQAPVAARAVYGAEHFLYLRALVGSPDGRCLVKARGRGDARAPAVLGERLAELLLGAGAGAILARL